MLLALQVGCYFDSSGYSVEILCVIQIVCRIVADCLKVCIMGISFIRGYCKSSFYINKKADADLAVLADWLKAHPDFDLALVGYADKGTGSPKVNMEVSKKRMSVVIARLEKLGVESSRITTDYKGDTVQPFVENDKNRVVTCTIIP